MKKILYCLLFLSCAYSYASNPDVYTIRTAEKIIDDKGNVAAVYVLVDISRMIDGRDDLFIVSYETKLDPTAVNDLKGAIEVWLAPYKKEFDAQADLAELKSVKVVAVTTKQTIDTSGIVLQLDVPK